jgi:predicted metal-dependent hydrolase
LTLPRGANGITLARLHWAEHLIAQKRFEEAERILVEAHRDASEVQGPDHLRARQAAAALARLRDELK